MRATEPLPLVPVTWMTGHVVLRVAEHVAQRGHAVEGQPADRTGPRWPGGCGLEVDVPVEPGEGVGQRRRASGRGAAGPLGPRGLAAGHERGVDLLEHDLAVDDALADVGAAREVVHDVEQHLLEDRPQATGAGAPQQRLLGDGLEGVVGELELDVLELEELAVLLDQRVLRLDEDADEGVLVEVGHRRR